MCDIGRYHRRIRVGRVGTVHHVGFKLAHSVNGRQRGYIDGEREKKTQCQGAPGGCDKGQRVYSLTPYPALADN